MKWPLPAHHPLSHPPDPVAEQWVFWTLALVPLWWILGIQVLVYPAVGWFLFWRAWHRPVTVSLPFGWHFWGLYTSVWILSLLINLMGGRAELGRSVTSFGSILGIWALTLVVWIAMRRLGVRLAVVVRAICVVGLCQLIAVAVGETYLHQTGHILQTQSVLVQLVPSLPAKVFFEARLYGLDNIGWDVDRVPRLQSFYYWAPLAGTMSLLICMGAWLEKSLFWKTSALLGGLLTVWLAAARAGQVGVVIALLLTLWFGKGLGRKILAWTVVPLLVSSPVWLTELYRYFFLYRKDSASGRLALYHETFEAFLGSPWLGYGTYGRAKSLDVPLGSHSQVLSTLYHTGLIGSALLLLAWIGLTVAVLRMVLRHPALSAILGAWVGLSFQMLSGELSAASVTVFTLASLLGGTWNLAEELTLQGRMPWLNPDALPNEPTPWQRLAAWWQGSPSTQVRQTHAFPGLDSPDLSPVSPLSSFSKSSFSKRSR